MMNKDISNPRKVKRVVQQHIHLKSSLFKMTIAKYMESVSGLRYTKKGRT
jgi:hypothetical protein